LSDVKLEKNMEKKKKMGCKKTKDVRSRIGRRDRLEKILFRLPTLTKRGKPGPISKKVEPLKKRRKWDAQSPKIQGSLISDQEEI